MDAILPKSFVRGISTAVVIVFLIVNLGVTPSSRANTAWLAGRIHRDDTFTPILAALSIDHYPAAGETATLTCTITTTRDAPGTQAHFELPTGARLVSGSLAWQGDLQVGRPVQLVATIAFDAPGEKSLFCRALRPVDAENTWGDLAELYLTVGQSGGQAGFAPVPLSQRAHLAVQDQPGAGKTVQNTPQPASQPAAGQAVEPPPAWVALPEGAPDPPFPATPMGQVTVFGEWHYFDRSDQYASAELLVEAVDGATGTHLAWCYTALDGSYSCGPFDNPGADGVRIVWYSYIKYAPYDDILATVYPLNPYPYPETTNDIANTYAISTPVQVFTDGPHNIGRWQIENGDPYERAFWLATDLERAWRSIWFNTGIDQTPPETTSSGTIQWKIDSFDGTFYIEGGNIHLTGADPLSNTTSIHEYGHNVMYTVYGSFLPSNDCPYYHYIQYASGPHCSWVEGWADFFPMAVNHDPYYRWASGASLNMETPSWTTSGWNLGDQVEGRVAGALWDILDSVNDGDDIYRDPDGIADIWDIVFHEVDSTFSEYWASWLARGHDNSSAGPVMDLYQNTINYRLGPANDDFANSTDIQDAPYFVAGLDTTPATTQALDPAAPCGSLSVPRQSRSVWYRFTPSADGDFNFDTFNSNYDTVLALWTGSAGSLSPAGCNDDAVVGTNSQSSVSTSLAGGTTYYIEALSYGSSDGGSLDLSVCKLPFPPALVSPGSATNDPAPTFTWSSVAGASDYEFILSVYSDLSSPIYDVQTSELSYTLPAGLKDGLYYWNVRGRNAAGGCNDFGGWNAVAPVIVDTTAPVTTVTLLPASVTGIAITLDWLAVDPTPGSGVVSYDVQYRVGENGVWTDWLLGITATSAVLGPLDPLYLAHGQTYFFRVRAHDQAGNVEDYTGEDGDAFTVYNDHQAFLPVLNQ